MHYPLMFSEVILRSQFPTIVLFLDRSIIPRGAIYTKVLLGKISRFILINNILITILTYLPIKKHLLQKFNKMSRNKDTYANRNPYYKTFI